MSKKKLFLTNKDMPEERMKNEVFPGFYINNPHLPFFMYFPIALAMMGIATFWIKMAWWQILAGIGASLMFWPAFEYLMHRYFFHWEPQHPFWKKLLYTVHHGHHDYPNDSRLMLVGPIVSLPAFLFFWILGYIVAGDYTHPFMAGVATCYMFYDWLHYASHHYNYKNKLFQKLKVHHMRHHYEDNDKNFAFTTLIWDILMRTTIKDKN